MKRAILIANFGGPRSLDEVEEFLVELLNDRDLIQTKLPSVGHKLLFTRIAKKRAKRVREDYASIGGGSPIFNDTEALAKELEAEVYTFHRYLPRTHRSFIEQLASCEAEEIIVFPLFPQFSYGTTGSLARFFEKRLPKGIVKKMRWIRSYATSPHFINAYVHVIKKAMLGLDPSNVLLFHSCHGVPKDFECGGDPYRLECEASFHAITEHFPGSESVLCYQSKFGPKEWLRPYTSEVCKELVTTKHVLFVPTSFTSDHIETLFEIEDEYIAPLRERGIQASRCPALNLEPLWVEGVKALIDETKDLMPNQMLLRDPKLNYCKTICDRCACNSNYLSSARKM